uniref:Uncharacterized protein n=1 Tax=Cacopsylla melanoneura TaxID=428564 RepID=A0A8D8WSQ6_9HEMI
MDTKNDADSLDNALKIMNNLFQLTEEFVNDTPDDGNQNQPNASTLSSSTSSKPNDSSAPGLTFPKLPDPDTFFESIVTNSKTTLESSTITLLYHYHFRCLSHNQFICTSFHL